MNIALFIWQVVLLCLVLALLYLIFGVAVNPALDVLP